MASTKNYLDFILEQLSPLENISARAMMGEYILYYNGKIVGGIYDDRLLIKITPSSSAMIENPTAVPPYDGAKPMYLIDDVENSEFLCELFNSIYDELPAPKRKK